MLLQVKFAIKMVKIVFAKKILIKIKKKNVLIVINHVAHVMDLVILIALVA